MNVRNRNTLMQPHRGFSMIDVLVAIVVLSVGLLALAALQGTLARGMADAKAQTQAVALAQQKLEEFRGFADKGANSVAAGSAYGSTYASIVSTTTPETITSSQYAQYTGASTTNTGSLTTYRRSVKVARFVLGGGSTCDIQPLNSANLSKFVELDDACAATEPIGSNEFKRVTVEVDQGAGTPMVDVAGIVSVASPRDSIGSFKAPGQGAVHPKVYIDPSKFAPGVIPIALGNNQAAASSDPQPETFSTGHITTRFSVQNYNTTANANGYYLLNKQFDFAVTSCTCTRGGLSTFDIPAYGPTYWNGVKYITPATIPNTSSGTGKVIGVDPVAGGNANKSSQDPILCQACCRDHHDDKALQQDSNGNPLKYDAFRPKAEYNSSGDHSHYDTNASNSLLTTAVTANGGEYFETCRFVRVDGINYVATDAREENHIVLAPISPVTISKVQVSCDPSGDSITSGNCYDHAVDSSTASNYAAFVKDYVNGFYTAYTTAVAAGKYPLVTAASVTPGVGDLLVDSLGNPSTLAKTYPSLINPPTQTILTHAAGALDYLEGRGLFIDYISPETDAALACIGQTSDPDCAGFANLDVLQVMPFVAVNQTNLDAWNPPGTIIQVTDAPIPTGGTFDPYIIGYTFDRGTVTTLKPGSDNAVATARPGNAGLIDSLSVSPSYPNEAYNCIQKTAPFLTQSPCSMDPPDTSTTPAYAYDTSTANGPRFQKDPQPYTVTGTPLTNVSFSLSTKDNSGLAKPTIGSPIAVSVTTPTLNPSTLATCNLGNGNKQPYTCNSDSQSSTIVIRFSSYNTQVSCKGNGCPSPPAVNDYKLCSISGLPNGNTVTAVVGSPVNAGLLSEQTSVTLTLNPSGAQTIATLVASLNITANFYQQSQTCP